ncbi:DnaA/Hda family protein, partial [Erysipelothrix rhusiopathiae]|nr:DnaA/Hda family protein [Erysipelothrix rhusiopathiae]
MAPNQTFDNFVVGPSNKESHSAALGCAYRPGQFYTPLFIYG